MLRADIRRTYDLLSGPAWKRWLVCLRAPGVQAVIVLRFGQWLARQPRAVEMFFGPLYLLLSHHIRTTWGIDIPRSVRIGPGLYIGHFGGIILSPDVRAGANLSLSHDVTLGISGRGMNVGTPTFGDDVYIAPGARVFGKVTVGHNVKIGANAVIHRDVPDNAVVALDPGFRIVSFKGNRPVPPLAEVAGDESAPPAL